MKLSQPFKRPICGLIGGMGPDATSYFYQSTLRAARMFGATIDQHHPNFVLFSMPETPDRSRALYKEMKGIRVPAEENPLPHLKHILKMAKCCGVTMVGSAINSYHGYYDRLRHWMNKNGMQHIELLHAGVETADYLGKHYPTVTKVGILGSKFTMQSGLFSKELAARGIEVIVPDDEVMEMVNRAVYEAKAGRMREAGKIFYNAHQSLRAAGAEIVLEACSEIPPAMEAFFRRGVKKAVIADYANHALDTLWPVARKLTAYSMGKALSALGLIASFFGISFAERSNPYV